ncbi:unnamed protein product, partial [Discosporangium mesarthrocarpum]
PGHYNIKGGAQGLPATSRHVQLTPRRTVLRESARAVLDTRRVFETCLGGPGTYNVARGMALTRGRFAPGAVQIKPPRAEGEKRRQKEKEEVSQLGKRRSPQGRPRSTWSSTPPRDRGRTAKQEQWLLPREDWQASRYQPRRRRRQRGHQLLRQ